MNDYGTLYIRVSKEELKQKISEEFKIPKGKIDDALLEAVINFFKSTRGEVLEWLECPPGRGGTLALMIPRVCYAINIKKSIWTLLGALLDAYFTKGGALATLTAVGVIGQCIGKLHKEKGEVCVYKELWSKETKEIEEIQNSLRRRNCPFSDFTCTFRDKLGTCLISKEGIQENLTRMKDIGAVIETKNKKWKGEL